MDPLVFTITAVLVAGACFILGIVYGEQYDIKSFSRGFEAGRLVVVTRLGAAQTLVKNGRLSKGDFYRGLDDIHMQMGGSYTGEDNDIAAIFDLVRACDVEIVERTSARRRKKSS